MIKGTGIDITSVIRIKRIIERWGDRFLNKVFTEEERIYCLNKAIPAQHFAARFAAKEAAFKMLGTGLRDNSWNDVTIYKNSLGKPEVNLQGKAARKAEKLGIEKIYISLSHEKNYAVAQVIAEGGFK
jgi:holo-[acyl-carrier protein] synthase